MKKYFVSNWMSKIVVPLAILLSVMVFVVSYIRLGHIARESQTYNRYTSCVLSIPALERDQIKIDACWHTVQEDTGINVKRYDQTEIQTCTP